MSCAVCQGHEFPKDEQYRRLAGLGVPVPDWTAISPDTALDPVQWGPYVVVKPALGRKGAEIHIKRAGRMWIRIFPDVPVSRKPAEVRMGSGKGTPEFWMTRIKPGRILFEIDGVPRQVAEQAFTLGAAKLPMRTRIVSRLGEGR